MDAVIRRPLRIAVRSIEAIPPGRFAPLHDVGTRDGGPLDGLAPMRRAKTDRAPREHRLFGGRADRHAHTDAMRLRKRERPDVGTEVRYDVWLDRVAAAIPPRILAVY